MSERDISQELREQARRDYEMWTRCHKAGAVPDARLADQLDWQAADEIDRFRQQNEDLMVMVHGESEKVSALTARCAELEKEVQYLKDYREAQIENIKGLVRETEKLRATLQGQDNGR